MENNKIFIVVVKDKKTGEVIETIGDKTGLTDRESLRVLSGVRRQMDTKHYEATTELLKTA